MCISLNFLEIMIIYDLESKPRTPSIDDLFTGYFILLID